MRSKSLLAVVLCAAALAGAGASSAFAGEVIGPPALSPTDVPTDNVAATSHANSICVFSGLNDKPFSNDSADPGGIVQSYGFSAVSQGFKDAVPSPGDPAIPGDPLSGCRGGSNADREPPPAP
jgi:hypothetical protein